MAAYSIESSVVADDSPERSYHPAPDQKEELPREAKFLITSTWKTCHAQRNKIPKLPRIGQYLHKPLSLSDLDDDLFYTFTADLQLTKQHQISWPLLLCVPIWLFIAFKPLLNDSWRLLVLPIVLSLFVGSFLFRIHQISLEKEIEERIDEWRPLFQVHGYLLEYIVDHPHWWARVETYVHIHQQVGGLSSARLQNQYSNHEEARYLIFFPGELIRRDTKARRLGDARRHNYYVKPPALRSLDDSIFRDLLRDLEVTTTPSFAAKFTAFVVFFALFVLVFARAIAGRDDTPILGVVLLGMYAIDRCIRLYTGLYGYVFRVSAKVDEWKLRLADIGFNLKYSVDQPTCWSWREDYVHIQREGIALDAASKRLNGDRFSSL